VGSIPTASTKHLTVPGGIETGQILFVTVVTAVTVHMARIAIEYWPCKPRKWSFQTNKHLAGTLSGSRFNGRGFSIGLTQSNSTFYYVLECFLLVSGIVDGVHTMLLLDEVMP